MRYLISIVLLLLAGCTTPICELDGPFSCTAEATVDGIELHIMSTEDFEAVDFSLTGDCFEQQAFGPVVAGEETQLLLCSNQVLDAGTFKGKMELAAYGNGTQEGIVRVNIG